MMKCDKYNFEVEAEILSHLNHEKGCGRTLSHAVVCAWGEACVASGHGLGAI